jgi:parvulin-like peptidyl-prolyl isomerase
LRKPFVRFLVFHSAGIFLAVKTGTSLQNRLLYFLLAGIVSVLSISCASITSTNGNQALPPVMATVNGQSIPTKLYEMYLKNGREALGLDPNTDEGKKKLEQLREGIVSELIDRALVAQEAQRRGLAISADQFAAAEQKTIRQFGGDQKYDAYLKDFNFTREEYRSVINSELYGEMMRNELSKDLAVSDKEVADYYEAHKADANLQQPEQVAAAHILIAARPNLIEQQLNQEKKLSGDALAKAVRDEIERRRQRAQELRAKAARGADFASMARELSEDPGTSGQGGELGTFSRDTHPKAFDEAAFALKPGEVSEVIQTEYGFHIIKVAKHEPARARTLAEATPQIHERLLTMRQAATLAGWLKETRRKAAIHIGEPFRFGALRTEFPAN